jgi:hypothetical protein
MPLPSDPADVLSRWLFALGALAALYVASSIILPVVLALVLNLLLQPLSVCWGVCVCLALSGALDRLPGHWSTCRSHGSIIGTGRDLG